MSATQQPAILLEDRINAIINHPQFEKELCMRGILLPEFQCAWHTFGGFDGMPEKYKTAILATEKRAEKRVIPLENVTENLGNLARFYALNGQPSTERILLSALHHLEEGRKDVARMDRLSAIRWASWDTLQEVLGLQIPGEVYPTYGASLREAIDALPEDKAAQPTEETQG